MLVSQRPKLDITEINFLNAKTFIPGKATWQPIELLFVGVYDDLVNLAREDLSHQFEVLLTHKKGSFSETWILQNPWFASLDYNDSSMQANLRFSSVKYDQIKLKVEK